MSTRVKVRAQYTVYTPSRTMEWLTTGIAAGFACAMFMGPVFETGSQWARFADIGTEREWGIAIAAVAYIRMSALIVNGHYRRTPAARAVTALLGAGLWAFMASLFFTPDMPVTTGVFTYGGLAIADLVSAHRAAKDAAVADWIWRTMAKRETQPAPMPIDWRLRQ